MTRAVLAGGLAAVCGGWHVVTGILSWWGRSLCIIGFLIVYQVGWSVDYTVYGPVLFIAGGIAVSVMVPGYTVGPVGLADVEFLAANAVWVGREALSLIMIACAGLSLMFTQMTRIRWPKCGPRIPNAPAIGFGLVLTFAAGYPYQGGSLARSGGS